MSCPQNEEAVKLNCWEFKNCGRIEGGAREAECGICPAYGEIRLDGLNAGKNGGRVCWFVEGTLCDNCVRKEADGTYLDKYKRCLKCNFYKYVEEQQGENLAILQEVFDRLR
ncbi:MAG: hypothetical protein KKE17_08495 [Proteobacteria bacterium]|nr:hypothetical protein [Pseudomonadota bacterium]MBU1710026.1 hypothetical protein [Pseudomonadota bacterium]